MKEYHDLQFTYKIYNLKMIDYNNKLTNYLFVFVQDIKASKHHINNTRSSSIHYTITKLQRFGRVRHNYYEAY